MIIFGKRYYCALCRKYKPAKAMEYIAGGVGMCRRCAERTYQFKDNSFAAPGNIKAIFSGFLYKGEIREAVKAFKFAGQTQFGVMLGSMLADKLSGVQMLKECDIVVPVPLHPNRQKERGYNQSEILAEEIAKGLGVPMLNDVLFRIKDTKRQSSLKGLARIENVKDAFAAHNESVNGKKIIIVDDICTMGETLKACERALTTAGARDVYAVTLCISPDK